MIDSSRLVEIFLQLVKIDALSGKEKKVADFIRDFLDGYDLQITEDKSYNFSGGNSGNLICRVGNGGDFVLLAHMDTARPTKKVIPYIENSAIKSKTDTVLGVDNRAGVSVLLYVLESIFKNNYVTKDFTAAFTTCEETTMEGSKNLLLNGNINKGFVFDSSLRPGNFINSACGAMGFKAVINGRASHSGIEPEKGINSVQIASLVISKIKQGRLDDETTLNIGKISGGSAVNVIPEKTIIEGEIRSFDPDIISSKVNELQKLFSREAELYSATVDFSAAWDFMPYTIEYDEEVFMDISTALKKVGLVPKANISLGGSDANSLNAKGIPSVNIGIGAQNPHSNEEFIFIEDLVKSAEIAFQLIKLNE
jgi:tripeptide aminopeptidase